MDADEFISKPSPLVLLQLADVVLQLLEPGTVSLVDHRQPVTTGCVNLASCTCSSDPMPQPEYDFAVAPPFVFTVILKWIVEREIPLDPLEGVVELALGRGPSCEDNSNELAIFGGG